MFECTMLERSLRETTVNFEDSKKVGKYIIPYVVKVKVMFIGKNRDDKLIDNIVFLAEGIGDIKDWLTLYLKADLEDPKYYDFRVLDITTERADHVDKEDVVAYLDNMFRMFKMYDDHMRSSMVSEARKEIGRLTRGVCILILASITSTITHLSGEMKWGDGKPTGKLHQVDNLPDIVEIPNTKPINVNIGPEEVKAVAALYQVY